MRRMLILISIFFITQLTAINSLGDVNVKEAKIALQEIKTQELLVGIEQAPLTPNSLRTYLNLSGVEDSDIVWRQAMLETGWLKSSIYKENKNLFGMKKPKSRQSKAVGENRGHATYINWQDSVYDYVLWQNYWKCEGYDMTDYYAFLKEVGYAEDVHYLHKLINLII